MKDFYYILGTPRDATLADIEAAYQKLALKFYRDGEEQDEFMDTLSKRSLRLMTPCAIPAAATSTTRL